MAQLDPAAVIKRTSAYAMILAEDHVLVSKLARGSNCGKWSLVGGGIEPNETAIQALIREVREEAQITLTGEPVYLRDFTNRYDYVSADGEPIILELTGKIYRVDLPLRVPCKVDSDGGSSDGCKWLPVSEVNSDLCTPFVLQAIGLI